MNKKVILVFIAALLVILGFIVFIFLINFSGINSEKKLVYEVIEGNLSNTELEDSTTFEDTILDKKELDTIIRIVEDSKEENFTDTVYTTKGNGEYIIFYASKSMTYTNLEVKNVSYSGKTINVKLELNDAYNDQYVKNNILLRIKTDKDFDKLNLKVYDDKILSEFETSITNKK